MSNLRLLTDPETQRDQFGSIPPASPANADQLDCQTPPPGCSADEPSLQEKIRQVRDHQQFDLIMLRLTFLNILKPRDNAENNETADDTAPPSDIVPPLADRPPNLAKLSCSEFNQIVSAVVRIHDDEREIFNIKPIEPQFDQERLQYEHLQKLNFRQLLELCRNEGIAPPDTCQTDPQEQNPTRACTA